MLIIYLKELRRLQQERRAQMKYPHTSSRKSLARLEAEIKLQNDSKPREYIVVTKSTTIYRVLLGDNTHCVVIKMVVNPEYPLGITLIVS